MTPPRQRPSRPERQSQLWMRAGLPLLASLTLWGCGEGDGPAPIPIYEVSETASVVLQVEVTFHRGEEPVAVSREVEVALADEERGPEPILRATLNALLAGPTPQEQANGLASFFSPETEALLLEVTGSEGAYVVNFRDFRALLPNVASSAGSHIFLTELSATAFALEGVETVEFQMDGDCQTFWNFLQRECTVLSVPASW